MSILIFQAGESVELMENDMTFAPSCTSTVRFPLHAASTPFNMFAPPIDMEEPCLSAIKKVNPESNMDEDKGDGNHEMKPPVIAAFGTEDTDNTVNKTDCTRRKSAFNLRCAKR